MHNGVHCGKGLCEKCAKKWSEPICDDCQKKYINEELSDLNKELMIYIGLVIAGAVFGGVAGSQVAPRSSTLGLMLTYAFCFPMYYAGWKWLNYITDRFSLFATINIWIIYFFIKLVLSAMVGVFALPYRLFKIFSRKIKLNELLSYVK